MTEGLAGVDMAFYENRYSYHTDRDAFLNVEDGTAQHVGDNVLALILAAAVDSDYIDNVNTRSSSQPMEAHFDVLGKFAFAFGRWTLIAWHLVILAGLC